MEYRKIFLSGKSSYIISLPKKWIKRMNLKPGDIVMVKEEDSKLVIYPKEYEEKRIKEVVINAVNDFEELLRYIIAYYLAGADRIKIVMENLNTKNIRESLRNIPNKLIGIEILEEHEKYILFEIVLDDKRLKIEDIIKRMANTIRTMLIELMQLVEDGNNEIIFSITEKENVVDKLYFLIVRKIKKLIISNDEVEDLRDLLGYRIVAKSFERISDHIENISKSILNIKQLNYIKKDIIKILNDILNVFEKTFLSLISKSINNEIFKTCKDIKNYCNGIISKMNSKGFEHAMNMSIIIYSLKRIVSYLTDISEITINLYVNRKIK